MTFVFAYGEEGQRGTLSTAEPWGSPGPAGIKAVAGRWAGWWSCLEDLTDNQITACGREGWLRPQGTSTNSSL